MGRELSLGLQRSHTLIDVSLLHSKTGGAILRGSTQFAQALRRQLTQLGNGARHELRVLEHQRRHLLERRERTMKRSEHLVKVYNLPPLKTPTQSSAQRPQHHGGKHVNTAHENAHGKGDKSTAVTAMAAKHGAKDATQTRAKGKQKARDLAKLDIQKSSDECSGGSGDCQDEEAEELRMAICSPIPQCKAEEQVGKVTCNVQELRLEPTAYPFITVDRCEESLPPVLRLPASPPDYSLQSSGSRSGSTNSLEVPSPITQRRSLDGKMVTVVTAGKMLSKYSRSEGSIPEALKSRACVDDPRFKALEAVLRPLPRFQPKTHVTTGVDVSGVSRSLSRSPSPRTKGRLLCRDEEPRHAQCYTTGSSTPP